MSKPKILLVFGLITATAFPPTETKAAAPLVLGAAELAILLTGVGIAGIAIGKDGVSLEVGMQRAETFVKRNNGVLLASIREMVDMNPELIKPESFVGSSSLEFSAIFAPWIRGFELATDELLLKFVSPQLAESLTADNAYPIAWDLLNKPEFLDEFERRVTAFETGLTREIPGASSIDFSRKLSSIMKCLKDPNFYQDLIAALGWGIAGFTVLRAVLYLEYAWMTAPLNASLNPGGIIIQLIIIATAYRVKEMAEASWEHVKDAKRCLNPSGFASPHEWKRPLGYTAGILGLLVNGLVFLEENK